MITYNYSVSDFKSHIENNYLIDKVLEGLNQNLSISEKRAIENSSTEMYKVINSSNISDEVMIGIEYKIPITNRRIDFLLAGNDGEQDNVVIIEFKQWSSVEQTDVPYVVKMMNRDLVHPSWQAYSYASVIEYFNEDIDKNNVHLEPVAFLHNLEECYYDELNAPIYKEIVDKAPIYYKSDYNKLKLFIEKYVGNKSNRDLLYLVDNGKIKPTKKLKDAMASMLNGNQEFVLLSEQKVIAEKLYYLTTKVKKDNEKHVVIVEGGAGTGKSLIAIDLLSKLIINKSYKAFYVAKSSYVKENYFKMLTRHVPQYKFLRTLFKGSGNFIDSTYNDLDCLIIDEAHRLTEKTKISWMFRGENQVKEIINAAKVSVFFIDEKQQVDIKDFGTIDNITKIANEMNAVIHYDDSFKLKSQFRCNGSDHYMAWIDSLLYNQSFDVSYVDVDYEIKIFDTVADLKNEIVKRNEVATSRMLTGDVFPWISRSDKSLIDIVLPDFEAQWNKTKTFATDADTINEVGCIHTSQGMEFDYVGLIIGDDLYYDVDDRMIKTDYSKHPDKAGEFKRPYKRKVDPTDSVIIDQLIRNTYRVLFSRGQKGTFIYCMDHNLRDYIKIRLANIYN